MWDGGAHRVQIGQSCGGDGGAHRVETDRPELWWGWGAHRVETDRVELGVMKVWNWVQNG